MCCDLFFEGIHEFSETTGMSFQIVPVSFHIVGVRRETSCRSVFVAFGADEELESRERVEFWLLPSYEGMSARLPNQRDISWVKWMGDQLVETSIPFLC